MVLFGREAHFWTEKQIRAGVPASEIARNFYQYYCDNGYEKNFVYGPLHGTGMIEVEAPWVETSSDYLLQPNMTFHMMPGLWLEGYGVAITECIRITDRGAETITKFPRQLFVK